MRFLLAILLSFVCLASWGAQSVTTPATITRTFTITNYTGTDLIAGDVTAQGIEVPGVTRVTTGSSLLVGLFYRCSNTNGTSVDLVITKQPITVPANSAPFNYSEADATNIVNVIHLTTGDFTPFATTNSTAFRSFTMPIQTATNSMFVYPVCRQAITNAGNDRVIVTLIPD